MPIFPVAVGIGWVLKVIALPLILSILATFGIGFAVYSGMNLLLQAIEDGMKDQFTDPAFQTSIDLLTYMNMDEAISIILSAVSVRMAIIGFNVAGNLKTFRLFASPI